jgi:hypothetical protein
MKIKTIDLYEIEVKILIRKDFWDAENEKMNKEAVRDKIQCGIEVPIEDINVVIK